MPLVPPLRPALTTELARDPSTVLKGRAESGEIPLSCHQVWGGGTHSV